MFVLSYVLGQFLGNENYHSNNIIVKEMEYASCNPVENKCRAYLDNHRVEFQIKKKPSALEPFNVELKTNGFKAEDVYVDFKMTGMDMGFNVSSLTQKSPNVWSAKVVLPVCSLGRNDWISVLNIKYRGRILSAAFPFTQDMTAD